MTYYVGVDIGGTKTALAVYDEMFSMVAEQKMPTECQAGCYCLVESIYRMYCDVLRETDIREEEIASVGVCSPGPLDLKSGRIVFIPTMGFRDEPIVSYFEKLFRKPIVLQNDTNAAALGEAIFGAGKDMNSVVYITVSTGVGCGIVLDGKILDGACDAAGELGHMKVERNGRDCACGGKGCLEAYASGTSVAAIASEMTGQVCQAKDVFDAARRGEEPYCSVVSAAGDHLGFAIGCVYQLLDPDVVIVGGSMTKDWDVLGPIVCEAAERYAEKIDGRSLRIVPSFLDGRQGLLGAAWLGKESVLSNS